MKPSAARWSPALLMLGLVAGGAHCSNVGGSPGNAGEAGACAENPLGDDGGGNDGGDDGGSPCTPSDSDGIIGGCFAFDLTVDDTGFTPIILKAQNRGTVTITLQNTGAKPHDFVVGCIPINYPGCPSQQCFPDGADIAPVAPGQSATTTFTLPYPEGIYDFRSDVSADSEVGSDGGVTGIWGQFVIQ